jgi:hypothetical protein
LMSHNMRELAPCKEPPEKGKDARVGVERTCRLEIDVRVRVNPVTRESVAGYFTPDETGAGLPWEWAERQNRLLSALIVDEECLDQFLAVIIRSDLELLVDSRRVAGQRVDDEEERLFEEVLTRMGSEDALYFREAMRDGLLAENIELFYRAFVINWGGTEIIGMRILDRSGREVK